MTGRLLWAVISVALAAAIGGSSPAAPASAPWPTANFIAENHRLCPQLDLSMLTDGTMTAEADRAFARLSPSRQTILGRRMHKRCAGEIGGFYCENLVTIEGLDEWGLTRSFVSHLCRRYRACSEPAAC